MMLRIVAFALKRFRNLFIYKICDEDRDALASASMDLQCTISGGDLWLTNESPARRPVYSSDSDPRSEAKPVSVLPCIIKEPEQPADAAVIWLHGLGADGNDFVPIIPELKLPTSLAVRFVFPNAPSIPVTINGGYVMPAWYDITAIDIDRTVDSEQLIASAEQIRALIGREVDRGIASERIVLAGFSQGGAVAYQTALTHILPLGGLLCLSTYFATADTLTPNSANREIPIRICHGTQDPMVPVALGKRACEQLTEMGYAVEYSDYPMGHEVCAAEIADIAAWLQQRLYRRS